MGPLSVSASPGGPGLGAPAIARRLPRVQTWRLPEIQTPEGSRSPVVLLSEDEARAVLVGLDPGQELGDHQVKEHAWVVVVDGTATIRAGGDEVEAPVGTLAHFE